MSVIRLLLVAALASGLVACERAEKPDVVLLHSGRFRGNVYPLTLQTLSPLQHYQYLAGYVKQVRTEAQRSGAKVVLVDLGDSLGGSFAAHVTGSMNMVTFFNELAYDAVVLSNLDADVPPQAIAALKPKVLNPFVAPDGEATFPGTVAAARLPGGGIPVYLLSNFYGDTEPTANPGRFPARFGMAKSGVQPLRNYASVVDALGERPAEALTLLSWMKFEPDGTRPEAFLESLRRLGIGGIVAHRTYGGSGVEAWQSSGFVDWSPPVSLNILRSNGGFVMARMDLKREGTGWKVLRHELLPMTLNTAPSDAAAVSAIEGFSAPIREADRVIGQLAQRVPNEKILEIYMKALATLPGADGVAYSAESIRSDWSPGELRASAVFNSLPWTSELVQVRLTPDQFSRLGEIPGLVTAPVEGVVPAETRTVTTSRFFGNLIQRRLNVPDEAVTILPQSSEFDFFAAYLLAHPEALAALHP